MIDFPHPDRARFQALFTAFSSWFFVAWLFGLFFVKNHSYLPVGLIITVLLCLLVIVSSLTLKCPNCGKNIAFSNKPKTAGSDWAAAKKQFFPIDALTRKPTLMSCPHCNIQIRFSN